MADERRRSAARRVPPLRGAVPLAVVGLVVANLLGCASPRERLIFQDTFDGPAGSPPSATNWVLQTGSGGWGNAELQTYTASRDTAYLDGQGDLVLVARADHSGDGGFTSARLTTKGRFAFTYGTVDARIAVRGGSGLWPAFWLLGAASDQVGWPACGEIDVMERYGADRRAHAAVHGPSDVPDGWAITAATGDALQLDSGFHDYRLEWASGSVRVLVDGQQVLFTRADTLSAPRRWATDQPMVLMLDLAVGGRMAGSPDTTLLPAALVVDSIRVWQG
jgi:beta-glucanase (GH16 family)